MPNQTSNQTVRIANANPGLQTEAERRLRQNTKSLELRIKAMEAQGLDAAPQRKQLQRNYNELKVFNSNPLYRATPKDRARFKSVEDVYGAPMHAHQKLLGTGLDLGDLFVKAKNFKNQGPEAQWIRTTDGRRIPIFDAIRRVGKALNLSDGDAQRFLARKWGGQTPKRVFNVAVSTQRTGKFDKEETFTGPSVVKREADKRNREAEKLRRERTPSKALVAAMQQADKEIGQYRGDERDVVRRYLSLVEQAAGLSPDNVRAVIQAAKAGGYRQMRVVVKPDQVEQSLMFRLDEGWNAIKNKKPWVYSKDRTQKIPTDAAAKMLAAKIGVPVEQLKKSGKVVAHIHKGSRGSEYIPHPEDRPDPLVEKAASLVPDDNAGIYLRSISAGLEMIPDLLQEGVGRQIGYKPGEVMANEEIQAASAKPKKWLGLIKYATPLAPVAIGGDVMSMTQRVREVGPGQFLKEAGQGFVDSNNPFAKGLDWDDRILNLYSAYQTLKTGKQIIKNGRALGNWMRNVSKIAKERGVSPFRLLKQMGVELPKGVVSKADLGSDHDFGPNSLRESHDGSEDPRTIYQGAKRNAETRDIPTVNPHDPSLSQTLLHTVDKGHLKMSPEQINGARIRSHEDLASQLQMLRRADYEVMRVVFLKDGKIIGTHSLSDKRIDRSSTHPMSETDKHKWLAKRIDEVQPDEIYFAHNHPSGSPKPSRQDRVLSYELEQTIRAKGVKYSGHVVVDHTEYGFIAPGASEPTFHPVNNVPLTKTHEYKGLNEAFKGPKRIAELAKKFDPAGRHIMLIETTRTGEVRRVVALRPEILKTKNHAELQRHLTDTSGGGINRTLVIPEPIHRGLTRGDKATFDRFNKFANFASRTGLLTDIISTAHSDTHNSSWQAWKAQGAYNEEILQSGYKRKVSVKAPQTRTHLRKKKTLDSYSGK